MRKFVLELLKREMERRWKKRSAKIAANAIASPMLTAIEIQERLAYAARPWDKAPDVMIGSEEDPYLLRWFVIPRNKWFNVYFHRFLRSDDDRALHDHPWANFSWLLDGSYDEIVFDGAIPSDQQRGEDLPYDPYPYPGRHLPPTKAIRRVEGAMAFRASGKMAHRVQLLPNCSDFMAHKFRKLLAHDPRMFGLKPVWTLFITGPKVRDWGFHCPKAWRPWEKFVEFPKGDARGGVSRVGAGCGEDA